MSRIVTRFAPSPTGYLHVGGARTALFNYLLARSTGGEFILRIEDTDRERSTPEAVQAILDGMDWLGLTWDELYYQSEREAIHNEYIDRLLASGRAYHCDCPPEKVQEMREKAQAEGRKPKYDGTCRERALEPGPNTVVRFKAPVSGKTVFEDMVKGAIAWDNAELDDLVLRRPDGSPTYNMAVVVDDATMGVTHIIRGDDHVNNTPRQVLLYEALELPVPIFGHVPMILGPDKKKLSKRHGAQSVVEYRDMGILHEAMTNYLLRLGWSLGDEEVFSHADMVAKFTPDNLGSSAAVFDMDKLLWLNAHWIKETRSEDIADRLTPFLTARGFEAPEVCHLARIVELLKPRAKTLVDMADGAEFFLYAAADLPYDDKAVAKFLTEDARAMLGRVRALLAGLDTWDEESLDAALRRFVEDEGLKFKALAQPLRVAISGKTASPGLFETLAVLGREESLARLDRALAL
jgi:glutamyl-tRNA synthetase